MISMKISNHFEILEQYCIFGIVRPQLPISFNQIVESRVFLSSGVKYLRLNIHRNEGVNKGECCAWLRTFATTIEQVTFTYVKCSVLFDVLLLLHDSSGRQKLKQIYSVVCPCQFWIHLPAQKNLENVKTFSWPYFTTACGRGFGSGKKTTPTSRLFTSWLRIKNASRKAKGDTYADLMLRANQFANVCISRMIRKVYGHAKLYHHFLNKVDRSAKAL